MSTNTSSSDNNNDQSKKALRPSTSDRVGLAQIVRPWALVQSSEENPEIAMTAAQVAEVKARTGRDIDV